MGFPTLKNGATTCKAIPIGGETTKPNITPAGNHVLGTPKNGKITISDCYSEFRNYIHEWENNEYRIYVDDKLIFTFSNKGKGFTVWPFDKRFHLFLNLAIIGNWGGQNGIDDSIYTIKQVNNCKVVEYNFTGVSAGWDWTGNIFTSDITTSGKFNHDFYNFVRIMLNPGVGNGTHKFYFDKLSGPHVEGLKSATLK